MKTPETQFDESAFWLEPDFVLADIVSSMVNFMELPIGITLFIKGIVLTGTLVSEREYLGALSDMFTTLAKQSLRPMGPKELEELEAAFSYRDMTENEPSSTEDPAEVFPPPVRHLHLKDPLTLTPQPGISFGNSSIPIIRVRLSAVDGWMLGQSLPFDDLGDESEEINGAPRRLH